MMTSTIDQHADNLLAAFQDRNGYAVNEPGCTLLFYPGPITNGIQSPSSLVVVELGRGSVLLDDPTHFNKFVFITGGLTPKGSRLATEIIRRLLVLMADIKAQRERVHVPQIEAPLSGTQGD